MSNNCLCSLPFFLQCLWVRFFLEIQVGRLEEPSMIWSVWLAQTGQTGHKLSWRLSVWVDEDHIVICYTGYFSKNKSIIFTKKSLVHLQYQSVKHELYMANERCSEMSKQSLSWGRWVDKHFVIATHGNLLVQRILSRGTRDKWVYRNNLLCLFRMFLQPIRILMAIQDVSTAH